MAIEMSKKESNHYDFKLVSDNYLKLLNLING